MCVRLYQTDTLTKMLTTDKAHSPDINVCNQMIRILQESETGTVTFVELLLEDTISVVSCSCGTIQWPFQLMILYNFYNVAQKKRKHYKRK